jgi:alpha-1,2-mannosyltransferase
MRPWSRWQLFAGLLAKTVGLVFAVLLVLAAVRNPNATDFAVYRGSVQSMLAGGSLYGFELTGHTAANLPFTYPPFAGLLLAPIGALPLEAGFLAWTLLQLLGCVLLAVLVFRGSPRRLRRPPAEERISLGLVLVALLLSDPVVHGVAVGQVSLLLVVLLVLDNLVVGRWRGVLTGIAGAVKLTPLVFLPYYLVTRQWREARNLGIGVAGATGLAFVVLPADSVRYWTELVFSTGRVGDVASRRNKSLLGMLAHWGLTDGVQVIVWLVLAAAIAGLALWRAARHHRRGEGLSAVLVVGVLSTVVSPISWPHHLVWASLAGVHLVLTGPRWARWLGAGLLVLLFANTPLMGYDDTAAAWLVHAEGLVTWGLVALAVLGFPRVLEPPGEPPDTEPAQLAEAA